MTPYDENQVYAFISTEVAAYDEAGRTLDSAYPIWTARMQFDAVTMGYAQSRAIHLDECRVALGLQPVHPPIPPTPTPTVTVIAGNPDVLNWPQTASLAHLGIKADALVLDVAGQSWPEVDWDESGVPSQAGTLWILMVIGGVTYATGVERLRGSQLHGEKPESLPSQWVADSLYNPTWQPMNRNPLAGEHIGMFIAAGDTRANAMNAPIRERSNTVWFIWPTDAGFDPVLSV